MRYVIDAVSPSSGQSYFLADPIDGEVRLAISLDYEDGVNSFDLQMSAWDNLGNGYVGVYVHCFSNCLAHILPICTLTYSLLV